MTSSAASTTSHAVAGRSAPGRRWRWWAVGAAAVVVWAVLLWGALGARGSVSSVVLFLGGVAVLVSARWLVAMLASLGARRVSTTMVPATETRRRELEQEKRILLRALKELEFDHDMGRLSPADFADIVAVYRARAVGVLRQLDEAPRSYRDAIEAEVAARVARLRRRAPTAEATTAPPKHPPAAAVETTAALAASRPGAADEGGPAASAAVGPAAAPPEERRRCPSCGLPNDADARFCKACGTRLAADQGAS